MVFCLLLDHNIIRLVFQRGNFTPQATGLMSMVFFYYSLSLLPFTFIRLLTFAMFARHESGAFLRLALFLYSLNVGFDLIYVALLRLGAKGIPLGMLTSLAVTSSLAFKRNLADLHGTLNRSLAMLAAKDMAAALLAAVAVWGLRGRIADPTTSSGNFLYLCVLCGAASLVFLLTLAATRAIPISRWRGLWQQAEGS
jgi:putative peptidoglycan lipid II flippase